MKNDKIRLPRPMGVTQLMFEYKQTQDPAIIEKIISYCIQQWIIANGRLCGKSYSILELGKFLRCDPDRIRIHMRDQMLSSKLWDKENQEAILDSLMGQQISWLLEDRMEIADQVKVLRESQGDHYTPFVTSELNKALGLKMSSTTNLQSLLKGLSGSGSVNIFNQVNQQNNMVGLTMEEAVDIIGQENSKVLNKSKELHYIESTYHVEELPEVVATQQQNVDTEKEGLNISKAELTLIADNYKGALETFDQEHHEIRREIELNIDRDSEDPELSIYPG